jgi:hypothetical protein
MRVQSSLTWEHLKLVVVVVVIVVIIKQDESLAVDSGSRDLRNMRHVIISPYGKGELTLEEI